MHKKPLANLVNSHTKAQPVSHSQANTHDQSFAQTEIMAKIKMQNHYRKETTTTTTKQQSNRITLLFSPLKIRSIQIIGDFFFLFLVSFNFF